MKKIYFLPILVLLASCGSGIKQVDKRSATELALLKKFTDADSTYDAQINNVTKQESYEESKKELTNFIKNTLKNKAEGWEAIITSIGPGVDGIDATFKIFKKADFEDRSDITEPNIILESENIKDEQLQKVLKTLQPDDVVLVSGTLVPSEDPNGIYGFQTISHVTIDNEDELRYPSFNFTLTDIKKKETVKQ